MASERTQVMRHRLSVDARRLSALADRGDRAFCDAIAITRDRVNKEQFVNLAADWKVLFGLHNFGIRSQPHF